MQSRCCVRIIGCVPPLCVAATDLLDWSVMVILHAHTAPSTIVRRGSATRDPCPAWQQVIESHSYALAARQPAAACHALLSESWTHRHWDGIFCEARRCRKKSCMTSAQSLARTPPLTCIRASVVSMRHIVGICERRLQPSSFTLGKLPPDLHVRMERVRPNRRWCCRLMAVRVRQQ